MDEDGYVDGFECFHASHADKKLGDVRKLFGLRGSQEGFDVDSKDNVIANSQKSIRRAISKLGIELTHDVFAQKLLATQDSNTAPLEDALLVRCWLLIDETFGFRPSYEFFEKVVTDTARKHPFHPVCDYLANLVWDGTARIDTWLSTYAKAADDAYTQAVGALVLIAAVRRVRNPGCKFDEMLVLESGEQGVFKSTALRTLCPREEWFSDDLPLNVDSKQMIERTSGKYVLQLEGTLHGFVPVADLDVANAKVTEFRNKNIAVMKDLAKFDGIDPEAVKSERAELAALKNAKPNERITELEGQLAAEKTARAEAEQKAAINRIRDTIQTKALALGARPNAVDIISGKAEALFTVVNGVVQAKPNTFSKTRPGELLTPDEWLADQAREFQFLFLPSSGSGAPGSTGSGTTSNVPELRDPTPEQLGRHADEIMAGKLRVVTSS